MNTEIIEDDNQTGHNYMKILRTNSTKKKKKEQERESSYDENGSNRLVNPSILFEQVSDDQTQAQHCDEHSSWNDQLGMVIRKAPRD